MPLKIERNDITRMEVDAIVNAANSSLLGGGGVDGAIHRAAGPALLEACKKLGGCKTGQAKITPAGNLSSKYVIHAVGPQWMGGNHNEKELLSSCYKTSLELARKNNCKSIAFPLISSGIYGYPKDQALSVAINAISQFLLENEMMVYLVIFDQDAFSISSRLYADVAAYIDDHYVERQQRKDVRRNAGRTPFGRYRSQRRPHTTNTTLSVYQRSKSSSSFRSLNEALEHMEETFSEMLLRKIDEAGLSDVQCYKKANIDRRLFSKIRSDKNYKPSKRTAIAFAIALELSLDETRELLKKAGYALSHSSRFDIIIEFFIENGNYDIFTINETLFSFSEPQLGF